MKYIYPLAFIAVVCLFSVPMQAEGTRELAPNGSITISGNATTDLAALHINHPNYNFFASFNNPDPHSRLYIHIKDPSKECVFFGFSFAHDNITSPTPPQLSFTFRVKDPNGNVVYGPINVTPAGANIHNWSEGHTGPAQIHGAGGYTGFQATSADLGSQGFTGTGDYYIEFADEAGDDLLIDFWDITVADCTSPTPLEKRGRVWSYNWSIFAVNDFGFPNRPFNGAFYVCAPDPDNTQASFVTRIDFNNSGFMPAAFNIAFNSFGAMNTGNVMTDRQSVRNLNATQSEYAIFLNDPVEICETAEIGEITLLGVSRCDVTSYCIKFITSKAGQVEILFDFDGNDNIYTPGTADLMIAQNVEPSQVGIATCIPWDGKDGLGNYISEAPNTQIPVTIAFAQGIYHFPIYDAELMTTGVVVQAIRPAAPNPVLYYDDSNIGVPSGTGEPVVQLSGCIAPCHGWSNYTTPTAIGFGNLCTINTWWFSQLIVRQDIFFLPAYYQCGVEGVTQICDGDTGTLTYKALLFPQGSDSLEIISVNWSGPGIVGPSNTKQITIDKPGEYLLDVQWLTDLGDTCSTSCAGGVDLLPNTFSSIDTLILKGDEVEINGEVYTEGGTYTQVLTGAQGCDSILTVYVKVINTVIHYDLNACWAFMSDGSHMDYSEFIPAQPEPLSCAEITGTTIHRTPPEMQKHSCTPGVNNSIAMCVSSLDTCDYAAGDSASIIFTLTVTPDPDTAVQITGIHFYAQAPATYNWISGPTGPNNYPTLYGIRILKNGVEIWRQEDIPTTQAWNLESFSFDDKIFVTDELATFTFELLPYCLVGNGADVAAWDIDEVSIQASCVSPSALNLVIGGTVRTPSGYTVERAEMRLADNLLFDTWQHTETGDAGQYQFGPLERRQDYYISGLKDGDDMNGVSTLDLLVLQKHLLGITPFTSAYQYIAADANRSQSITVLDIVELKKLLLGIYAELPRNTSWRMHDAAVNLSLSNPWQLREIIHIEYLLEELHNLNFAAIKIGDLNGDASSDVSGGIITGRDILQLNLDVNDKMLNAGTVTRIDITSKDVYSMSGIQLALQGHDLDIIAIEPAAIPITSADYAIAANGEVRISWMSESAVSYRSGDVLFRLVVKSRVDAPLSKLLALQPTALRPEGYVNSPVDPAEVHLVFSEEVILPGNELYFTLTPNPVRESMTVSFDMMCAETVYLSFYDIAGRLMYRREINAIIGRNELGLTANEMRVGQGIAICQLETSMGKAVKKVVVVKD